MTELTDPVEEREQQWQDAAEYSTPGAGGEAEIELYRLVYSAVREAELPEAPPGFALRMEQAVFALKAPNRAEAVEEWGVRLGLLLLVILMLAAAAPAVLSWVDRWWVAATPAPWLPAAASGAALLVWNLVVRRRNESATAGSSDRN